MRILLLGDYSPDPRLGSSKVYFKLAAALRAAGHECDVALADTIGSWPRTGRVRPAVGPLLGLRAIRRALQQKEYDVIDAASADGWLYGLSKAQRGPVLIARSHGIEHLNYQRMLDDAEHGLRPKAWYRRIWYPATRLSQVALAARCAQRMIVANPADADYVVARGWKQRHDVDVIAHGVSSRYLTTSSPQNEKRGAGILFCGSWDHMKGIAYLTAAFAELVQRGLTVPLTILGSGQDQETILNAFPRVVRPLVTVKARAEEEQVMQAYRTHDVLAFPSTYEGFGMVLLEAMSQALPVVTTPVGAALSLVESERNGLVVPPRSPTALADALQRILTDAELAARLGTAARATVAHCSWEHTAQQTLSTYEIALRQRSRVPAHALVADGGAA